MKQWFLLGVQDHAVGGFPDGRFGSVADIKLSFSRADGLDAEPAHVALVRRVQEVQIPGDFARESGVREPKGPDGFQLDQAHFTRWGEDRDLDDLNCRARGRGARFHLGAHQLSGDRAGWHADFHARAADLVQKTDQPLSGIQVDGKLRQPPVQGRGGIVRDPGHLPFAQIDDRE